MSEDHRRLAIYGSDLSRWPDGASEAREALLSNQSFRRSWETERDLDRRIAADRTEIDSEIMRSGALARLGRLSERYAAAAFVAIPWRRVAAGVLLAGVLGGALDYLVLPQAASEPVDLAFVDPLDAFDTAASR